MLKAEELIYQNVDDEQIHCDYIKSENNKGVIIVGDLTTDKRNYSALVNELVSNGYGVFTFDMPSSGTSEGSIPYRYNENADLAEQFYNALVVYSQVSQIPIENIHIIGYGQGARIALETASYGFIYPKSLTLIGCSINFSQKLNYDIINYSDDIHIDWIEELAEKKFGYPIYVISSSFDDISSTEDNKELANRLSAEYCEVGFTPHSYLSKSPSITKNVVEFVSRIDMTTCTTTTVPVIFAFCDIVFWLSTICAMYFMNVILKNKTKYQTQNIEELPMLPKGFIKKKLGAYGFALPLGIIVGVCIYHIPLVEVAYKNLFFICAYTAYGITLAILYSLTDFGKSLNKPYKPKSERIYLPFGIFALLLLIIALEGAVSSFNPFSIIRKPYWAFALTMLFSIGFYVDAKERKATAFTTKDNFKLTAVNYLTFWILPIVFAAIGLYSNMAYALYSILYFTTVAMFGEVMNTLDCPDYLSSIFKGFLLQFTVFAQTIMFK